MTLREKFKNIELDEPYIFMCEQGVTECEKITDEFAIGFLQWANENYHYYHGDGEYHNNSKWYKVEELLEMFKKEKEL
jgi:hypothetical protein